MNRGIAPPSMRAGYSNQQPQLPQSRSSSTAGRIPNNKMGMANNGWNYPNNALGSRPNLPPTMSTFAQSLSGSQPATPLDPSEFPTLSQQNASNPIAQSLWASSSNARTLAQPSGQRPGQSNLILAHQNQAQHQNQQDDLFTSSSQIPNAQSAFRFGNQNPVGQSAISHQGPSDEFPPLNRNGEINQTMLQMQGLGFNGQSGAFGSAIGGSHNQQTNGLLNQLTNSRAPSAGRTGSPGSIQGFLAASRASEMKSRADNDIGAFSRPIQSATSSNVRDQLAQRSASGAPQAQNELHNELYRTFEGDMQRREASVRAQEISGSGMAAETSDQLVEDPCPGLSDLDRFGIKGYLSVVKGPYNDQVTLLTGIDLSTMGLDLNMTEMISECIWSPFDDAGARPEIPAEGSYEIPDCYIVGNVAPIDNKIPNFSDETLFLLFYQNTGEILQADAARELSNRNWRYHKKFQVWLTKDLTMNPVQLNQTSERGVYTFWNPKSWEREKREFTLHYSDLEMLPLD